MDGEASGHTPTRRGFVNWVLGTTAGAFLIAVLYPVARYLTPPKAGESSAASVVLDLKPADMAPNTGRIVKFGSRPAIVIRTPAGDLRAFSAICTHLNCTVQYRPDLSHIWCACHNGHFDLNGKNIAGPPPRPLAALGVNVAGTQLVISKGA